MQKSEITEELLQEVAEKFGKIPNTFTKTDDIINAGYMTMEEFLLLPQCPRSKEMNDTGTVWPYIGGRKTYPLYKTLRDDEKKKYLDYKKEHKSGASVSSGKELDPTIKANVEEILAFLKDKGADDKLLQKFWTFAPTKKVEVLEELFGTSSVQAITKCNFARIMYRGPNGEFMDEAEPKGATLYAYFDKGFEPKFTKADIKAKVEKLLEKGIDVRGCITDWA